MEPKYILIPLVTDTVISLLKEILAVLKWKS